MADDSTLWVGGLADEVTEDHLFELFLQAGPLAKVTRPKERDGSLKKFAFVEFTHAESVPYAIQVMDGIKLFNHHLRLKGRTGSQHDTGRSDSPASHSHHFDSRGQNSSRGNPDYHRSRSYQGHNYQRHGINRSMSGGDDRRSNLPFSGPNQSLVQAFSNTAPCHAPNMQPHFEDRRNRLLNKQNMSLSAHSQMQGGHQYGGFNNYGQSFSGYGQQQSQQQWYLNNY